jgi:hypothetical protein
MRRFLTISLITLALVISAAGSAPAAHAELGALCYKDDSVCDPKKFEVCDPNALLESKTCISNNPNNVIKQDKMTQDTAAAKTVSDAARTENAEWGFGWIMGSIVKLFAWLVGIAALTLNFAVDHTVVGMGGYVKNLSAIGTVWRILRDIGNLMLIFGFLAIGISIILDSDWYGGGKKLIPALLIAAVFTNFSLFAAEAVVDVGNLFATQIYTQINGGSLPPPTDGVIKGASNLAHESISTLLLNKLGLQSIFAVDGAKELDKEVFKAGNSWIIGFMAILLFIITAFVMFTLAFVLISRFIVLILLIMVSPVGVAGMAVPGLKPWADKWWHTLFQQTITAPILLLMLYIALSVITDDAFLTGFGVKKSDSWLAAIPNAVGLSNLGGLAAMMLSFLVAMGLLLAVVYFAKTLSAVGAGWATKTAGKLSFGATALGMRSTVGWGSQRLSRAVRTSRIGGTKTGRLLAGTFDRGAKGSFDVRGTGALKNIPGGIDAGVAQKGGYRARQEAAIKGHQDYIKSVGEAIDERGTKENAEAQKKRYAAEIEVDETKNKHDAVSKQLEGHKREVAALEEEERNDKHWKTSPDNLRKLEAAQQKAAASEQNLAEATAGLRKATENLSTAQSAEKKVGKGISDEKKAAQVRYAGNIGGSVPGWVMFGPGGSSAANAIVKDALKKEDKLKKIKELLEEPKEDKPKEEKEKEDKKEEPKPEAPKA